MSTIITGASGQLGRRVAELLLEDGSGGPLVLLTRSPGKLDDLAARGAEVRAADFDDPASLTAAFAGGERLLLVSTDRVGTRIEGHRAAIDAATAAGVRSIAYTSVPNPSDSNPAALVVGEHRATEEHVRASGLAWTFLRNSLYAELQAGGAHAALATGTHAVNDGDGRTAFVSREDCAAAAAAVLATDGHDFKAYDITGPEALSPADVAALVGELGGKPVEAVAVDDAAYAAALVEHAGLPAPVADVVAGFGRAARLGYLAVVSTAVEDLTGRPPRSLRDVLTPLLAAA